MACLGVSEVVGSGRKQETRMSNMIAKNGNVKTNVRHVETKWLVTQKVHIFRF